MTDQPKAYVGAQIFDGYEIHSDSVLIVKGDVFGGILPAANIPAEALAIDCTGETLAPGFVDIQVNGGGGVMFNDDPSLATLEKMAAAHAGLAATSILPTLITDRPDKTSAAIDAVVHAVSRDVPGVMGLHLEGPHLSHRRKGAHDPKLIRRMEPADLVLLLEAAQRLPVLMITVAPESVTPDQIEQLTKAGAILSLGHTDAGYDECQTAFKAGASCATHLFNAMSQLTAREPGLVGAALHNGAVSAGIIADFVHVLPASLATALAAKQRPGQVFLVSDAMATAGSDIGFFTLNNRKIERSNGRLTLTDGTLAGADLDLPTAVKNVQSLGVSLPDVLAMVTSIPARVAGALDKAGTIGAGRKADFVSLDRDIVLTGVWQSGRSIALA